MQITLAAKEFGIWQSERSYRFKEEAQRVNRAIPIEDERYKEFRPGLERHQWGIRQ